MLAVLVLALLIGAIPAAHAWRRRRRRARADSPRARVLLAWEEAGESLALAGHPQLSWETTYQYAQRVRRVAASVAQPLARLAQDTAAASFAASPPAVATAERAEMSALEVTADVRSRAARWRRLAWSFDPRPLLPRARRRGSTPLA
jgi:hypothetical protein